MEAEEKKGRILAEFHLDKINNEIEKPFNLTYTSSVQARDVKLNNLPLHMTSPSVV